MAGEPQLEPANDGPRERERLRRAAIELNQEPPSELTIAGWWEQAKTLEDA